MNAPLIVFAIAAVFALFRWFIMRRMSMWLIDWLTLLLYGLGFTLIFVTLFDLNPVMPGEYALALRVIGVIVGLTAFLIETEWLNASAIMDSPINLTKTVNHRIVRGDGVTPLNEKDRLPDRGPDIADWR